MQDVVQQSKALPKLEIPAELQREESSEPEEQGPDQQPLSSFSSYASSVSESFDPTDEETYERRGDYYECAVCDQFTIHFKNPGACENQNCPSNQE